ANGVAERKSWVAHASRVLVSASRRNNLPRKVRESGTLPPTRETRALPGMNVHRVRLPAAHNPNLCDALDSPKQHQYFTVFANSRARSRNNSRACGIEPPSS